MRKADKQDVIADAAITVFCSKGYANTRMADIARQAGVSYGLVYHYFKSKEELFDFVVGLWWEDLYEMLDRERKSQEAFETRLENVVSFFLDVYQLKPELISIFITEVSRSSVYHTDEGLKKFYKAFGYFQDIILQGQNSGLLRSDVAPHYLTYIFLGSIESLISVIVLGREKIDETRREKAVRSLVQVFVYGAQA